MLARTATAGECAGRVRRGPVQFDLVGELTARTRKHGKPFRPVLAHWGWVAGDGDHRTSEHIVRVAAALELLQLFALIQDDVMDRSRRDAVARASTRALPNSTGPPTAWVAPVLFGDRTGHLGFTRETASTASVTMSYP